MELGIVGLGRMGAYMAARLLRAGHRVVAGTSGGVWGKERGYCMMIGGEADDGAGHFVKMMHNGIEYGLMAAYAEGLNILRRANVGKEKRATDAETTPLEDPEAYQYVPAPILSTAIAERFVSRGADNFPDRVLSAMRFEFGGHEEKRP